MTARARTTAARTAAAGPAAARWLVAVAVALSSACGLPTESAPRDIPAQELTPADAPAPVPGVRPTTLYLVRDGALAPVTRRTASTGSPRNALQLLVRGPSAGESAQGLSTALGPDSVVLDGVGVRGSTVTVALADTRAGLGRNDEVLAYGQVVATLTALPGVSAVLFVRDGAELSVPRADGSLAEGPLTRRDYAELL